jgi:hypothetical protein
MMTSNHKRTMKEAVESLLKIKNLRLLSKE